MSPLEIDFKFRHDLNLYLQRGASQTLIKHINDLKINISIHVTVQHLAFEFKIEV
jgi:hypothetical protein